jgi:hypothetical protein
MGADSIHQQCKQDKQQTAAEFCDSRLIACQLIGYVFLIT